MLTPPGPGLDVGVLLDRVEGIAPIEAVEAAAETLAEMLDANQLTFLIADLSGRAVVRLTTGVAGAGGARLQAGAQAETLPLSGTVYERVLRTQEVDVRALNDGARMIAPVTERGDAIGLLELVLPAYPSPAVVADVAAAAHALAYVVIAARRYTDVFERGQRTTPFSLPAEIQRRLLPASHTCEAGQFTLAGWLEPAASVGGDTFDYTLNRDALHVSITDAVGHEVEAASLATLFVGALRNARRKGLDLAAQARYANDALADNGRAGQFVTGQLLRVDLSTPTAAIVNAGHPLSLRLRNGRVQEIGLGIEPPFGVVPGQSFRPQEFPLRPGDRIVFLTDGMQAGALPPSTPQPRSFDADTRGEAVALAAHAAVVVRSVQTGAQLRSGMVTPPGPWITAGRRWTTVGRCDTEGRGGAAGAAGVVSLVTGVGCLPCPNAGHPSSGLRAGPRLMPAVPASAGSTARARGRIPTAGGWSFSAIRHMTAYLRGQSSHGTVQEHHIHRDRCGTRRCHRR